MKKGKAYAHKSGNQKGDLYHTPKSLVWVAEDIIRNEFHSFIYEPCYGNGAIFDELNKIYNGTIFKSDLYTMLGGHDYLNSPEEIYKVYDQVITNPPFSLWDEFVLKAKTHCKKFMFIGRLNYFGTQSRLKKGIWNNLKGVYPFSRYVDYQTPYRIDGFFHVGAMATAWFLWDMEYSGNLDFRILDVNKYAVLGSYLKTCNCGNKVKPDNKSEIWFCERCNYEVYRRVS